MRASKHHSGLTDEPGGSFKPSGATLSAIDQEVAATADLDGATDLYPDIAPVVIKRPRNLKNRLQAKNLAEARLNHLSEELLELTDELRRLHPLMADALDAAWASTDTALEILLDDAAW